MWWQEIPRVYFLLLRIVAFYPCGDSVRWRWRMLGKNQFVHNHTTRFTWWLTRVGWWTWGKFDGLPREVPRRTKNYDFVTPYISWLVRGNDEIAVILSVKIVVRPGHLGESTREQLPWDQSFGKYLSYWRTKRRKFAEHPNDRDTVPNCRNGKNGQNLCFFS